MPISSMLVDVEPGTEDEVTLHLTGMEGVTVQGRGGGRVVVVTDTASVEADRDLTASIRDVPHVVHANVVFTSVEDCLPGTEVGQHG
jgi:nitrate reductase NapAB chaperone NapD